MLKDYIHQLPDIRFDVRSPIQADEILPQFICDAIRERSFAAPYQVAKKYVLNFMSEDDSWMNIFASKVKPDVVSFCNEVIVMIMQARANQYAHGLSDGLVREVMQKLPAFVKKAADPEYVFLAKMLISHTVVGSHSTTNYLSLLGITVTEGQQLVDAVREHPWYFINDDYVYMPIKDVPKGAEPYVMGRVFHLSKENPNIVEVELETELNGERFYDVPEADLVYVNPQPSGIRYFSEFEEIAELNEKRFALLESLQQKKEELPWLLEELPIDEMSFENARFVTDCEEKNGHLYQNGVQVDNGSRSTYKDVYYCHQLADGYCEDSWYGTMYFRTRKPDVFVAIPFSI